MVSLIAAFRSSFRRSANSLLTDFRNRNWWPVSGRLFYETCRHAPKGGIRRGEQDRVSNFRSIRRLNKGLKGLETNRPMVVHRCLMNQRAVYAGRTRPRW